MIAIETEQKTERDRGGNRKWNKNRKKRNWKKEYKSRIKKHERRRRCWQRRVCRKTKHQKQSNVWAKSFCAFEARPNLISLGLALRPSEIITDMTGEQCKNEAAKLFGYDGVNIKNNATNLQAVPVFEFLSHPRNCNHVDFLFFVLKKQTQSFLFFVKIKPGKKKQNHWNETNYIACNDLRDNIWRPLWQGSSGERFGRLDG